MLVAVVGVGVVEGVLVDVLVVVRLQKLCLRFLQISTPGAVGRLVTPLGWRDPRPERATVWRNVFHFFQEAQRIHSFREYDSHIVRDVLYVQ